MKCNSGHLRGDGALQGELGKSKLSWVLILEVLIFIPLIIRAPLLLRVWFASGEADPALTLSALAQRPTARWSASDLANWLTAGNSSTQRSLALLTSNKALFFSKLALETQSVGRIHEWPLEVWSMGTFLMNPADRGVSWLHKHMHIFCIRHKAVKKNHL